MRWVKTRALGSAAVLAGFVAAQALLAAELLSYNVLNIKVFILLLGVVVAIAVGVGWHHGIRSELSRVVVLMLAVGGFGMFLGCTTDLGQVGLYSVVELCRAQTVAWVDIDVLRLKLGYMAWAYLGMLVAGNAAMLVWNTGAHARSSGRRIRLYLGCNLGMLVGMVIGDTVATQLVGLISIPAAAGLMLALMLLYMAVGMWCFLGIFWAPAGMGVNTVSDPAHQKPDGPLLTISQ